MTPRFDSQLCLAEALSDKPERKGGEKSVVM